MVRGSVNPRLSLNARMSLDHRLGGYLGLRGEPCGNLLGTVHGERLEPVCDGGLLELAARGSLVDHFAQGFGHGHHLEYADSALVTATAARETVRVLASALGACPAD